GYIVADNLAKKQGFKTQIKRMETNDRYAMDWETLIAQAKHQWKEFLDHVKQRAPEDKRLKAIGNGPERDESD
ncbi:MAG: hypothetical protein GDA53_06555, partial [Rhodobacteraceae bacterium]|nr:hypothetical protein [Paracoccaceae bacterium]